MGSIRDKGNHIPEVQARHPTQTTMCGAWRFDVAILATRATDQGLGRSTTSPTQRTKPTRLMCPGWWLALLPHLPFRSAGVTPRRRAMDFPILDLMDQPACYQRLLELLHPDGLTCPRCGG